MDDPIGTLGVLDMLVHPRLLGRWIVSQVAVVGFALVALPIGCGVMFLTMLAGSALGATLLLVFKVDAGLTGPIVFGVLAVSLAVTFLALVRLYRAMPKKVRAMIEMPDEDDATAAGANAATAPARTNARELAALDARLGPPDPPPNDPLR